MDQEQTINRFSDQFAGFDCETLLALARKEKWFHNMRIGDYETGSWVYVRRIQVRGATKMNPVMGGKAAREPNYDRVTVLAQAVPREQIAGRTPKLIEFHKQIQAIGGYTYADFESQVTELSALNLVNPIITPRRELNIWLHKSEDPLQPSWREQGFDRSRLEGNFRREQDGL